VQSDVAIIDDLGGDLVGNLSATPVASSAGTGGTSSGARAAMILARLRSGTVLDGRLVRGRWYLGPMIPAAVGTTGAISAGTITAVNGAGVSLLAPGATTSALAIWHRPKDGTGGAAVFVSSISAWEEVAVLRSRRDA
jgi:hypothetical protein